MSEQRTLEINWLGTKLTQKALSPVESCALLSKQVSFASQCKGPVGYLCRHAIR